MSLPSAEAAPVSGARRPILMGPLCAGPVRGTASATADATRKTTASVRPWMRFIVVALSPRRPAERAEHATGCPQDDADVDDAEDQEPALRVDAHEVLQEHDGRGAERRTGERARPAERDHEEGLHRGDELDVRGADEAVVVRPEHAGKRGEEARDHEREVLVEPHVVAERSHARLALADAL